jgi:hypothetical protein
MIDPKTYAGHTVSFEAVVRDEPVELPVILTGNEITDKLTLQLGANTFHRAIRTMSRAEEARVRVVHMCLDMPDRQLGLGVELTGNEEADRQKLDDLAWNFYQGMLSP